MVRVVFGTLICGLLMLGILTMPVRAEGVVPIRQAAESLDLSQLQQFIQSLDDETKQYLPQLDPKTWGLTGPEWKIGQIGQGILRYFLRELVFNFRLIGELVLLALALAVMQNLRSAFEGDTVNQLAFGVSFLVVMGIVLNSMSVTFSIARSVLQEMSNFMFAIIPLFFTLITAGGGITSATIVHPLIISSVNVVGGLVSNLVFPLIMFAGVLGMVNYLSEGFQTSKLSNLLKNVALGIMGLAMAVFVGLVTIRGFTAAVVDSTALRTAKYVTNTFLPVVGSTLSDNMEMAAGCSVVLKSGLGVFGLGLITLITVFPLLKILAVATAFKLTGAIMEPLGSPRLADALQTISGTFLNLFGAVAIVGLMFFIAIAVLVGISSYRIG